MLNFFKILFLSKTILLTQDFINIDSSEGAYVIQPQQPISAITSGANLKIDVSHMLPRCIEMNISECRRAISTIFPSGSIVATLSNGDIEHSFIYEDGSAIGNETTMLVLHSKNIPLGVDFNEINIKTSVNLKQVKVYWQNYQI